MGNMMEIKLLNEHAAVPQCKTIGSAGFDLQANIQETIVIPPRIAELIPTGIAVHINNPEIAGKIYPRSGKGHKAGKVLGNCVGIIDSDYTGEIFVSMLNRTDEPIEVSPHEFIAQILFEPVFKPDFEIVERFSKSTARGDGGFGHTDG